MYRDAATPKVKISENQAGKPQIRSVPYRGLRRLLLMLGLMPLVFLLSACSYPGKGDCKGVGNDSSPTSGVTICVTNPARTDNYPNQQEGGEWYIQWILNAIKTILVSIASAAISVAIAITSAIFNNTASLDFPSCHTSDPANPVNSPSSITCAAHSVWQTVNMVAGTALLPLFMFWRFFSATFLGAIIEEFSESLFIVIPKFVIACLVLIYSDYLYTSLFGLSEMLFDLILGGDGRTTVYDIGVQVQETVTTLSAVNNLGMLSLLVLISLITSLVFVVLGIAFFIRTVLIILMFVLVGPAIVAGTTEEFRGWTGRWWSCVQALLISPIPVAVCLVLVLKTSSLIINSSDVDQGPFQAATDPYQFATYMIYVTCFLIAASWFLIALTAQSSRIAFGALRSGARAVKVSLGGVAAGAGIIGAGGGAAAQPYIDDLKKATRYVGQERRVVEGFGGSVNSAASSAPPTGGTGFTELGQSIRGLQGGIQEMSRQNSSYLPPQLPPPGNGWGNGPPPSPPPSAPSSYDPPDRPGGGGGMAANVQVATISKSEVASSWPTPSNVSEGQIVRYVPAAESYLDLYGGKKVRLDKPSQTQAKKVKPIKKDAPHK